MRVGDGSLQHCPLDADVSQAVVALSGSEVAQIGPAKLAALLRFMADEVLDTDLVREVRRKEAVWCVTHAY